MNFSLNSEYTLNNRQLSQLCQQELKNLLDYLAPKQKAIVGEFFRQQLNHMTVFVSHDTIAQKVDCSRKHVVETTNFLNEIGFMFKIKRGIKKTCLYRFPTEFFKFDLRQILVQYFPFLKWIPLNLLTAVQDKHLLEEVTLRKIVLSRYLYLNTNTTKQVTINVSNLYINRKLGDLVFKKNLKEEKKMNAYQEARQLLNLSLVGQAKLVLFEEQAIQFAIEDYKKALKIRKKIYRPFVYFFNIAKTFSIENKLKLDWKKYYEWKEKIGFDEKSPDTEYKYQRGSTILKDNKFIDNSIVKNKDRVVVSPVVEKRTMSDNVYEVKVDDKSKSRSQIYYNFVGMPTEVLQEDIVSAKKSLQVFQQISPNDSRFIFMSVVVERQKKILQNLEAELAKRNNNLICN